MLVSLIIFVRHLNFNGRFPSEPLLASSRQTVLYPLPIVTFHPGFSETVPIFKDASQKKSQFSRDAHLSRFLDWCPGFVAICPSLQAYAHTSVAKN